MYYFGLIHAYWFFAGFGVDYTVFELTTEDYLLRSADGLFVPFSIVALIVLLLAWAHQLFAPRLRGGSPARLVRASVRLGSLVGLALMAVAGAALLRPERFAALPAVGGLALVLGVLLLVGVIRSQQWLMNRKGHPLPHRAAASWVVAEWAAVVVLVSVGLFWAVGDWSAAVGTTRANDVVRALPQWPATVLYSERSLSLNAAGAIETRCTDQTAAYAYRYDGLKLITQEGGQMLLLAGDWSRLDGTAVVLTKSESLRLDFRPAGAAIRPTC